MPILFESLFHKQMFLKFDEGKHDSTGNTCQRHAIHYILSTRLKIVILATNTNHIHANNIESPQRLKVSSVYWYEFPHFNYKVIRVILAIPPSTISITPFSSVDQSSTFSPLNSLLTWKKKLQANHFRLWIRVDSTSSP